MPDLTLLLALAYLLLTIALISCASWLLGFHTGSRTPDLTIPPRATREQQLAAHIANTAAVTPAALPLDLTVDVRPIVEELHTAENSRTRSRRSARINQARVIRLTQFLTQPRRPTRAALAAALVEVDGRKLPAVPPSVMKHVEER
jgi:hypothetical protein